MYMTLVRQVCMILVRTDGENSTITTGYQGARLCPEWLKSVRVLYRCANK